MAFPACIATGYGSKAFTSTIVTLFLLTEELIFKEKKHSIGPTFVEVSAILQPQGAEDGGTALGRPSDSLSLQEEALQKDMQCLR